MDFDLFGKWDHIAFTASLLQIRRARTSCMFHEFDMF